MHNDGAAFVYARKKETRAGPSIRMEEGSRLNCGSSLASRRRLSSLNLTETGINHYKLPTRMECDKLLQSRWALLIYFNCHVG